MQEYASAKGFRPVTQQRWLSWEADDAAALLELVVTLKAGENHVRDLLDWLEEIALRDRVAIRQILRSETVCQIQTAPRLGRADRLKRVKEHLRRLRFPRLSRIEDRIQAEIRSLKLDPAVKLSAPAGLEGGTLRVEFSVGSGAELRRIAASLGRAAESPVLAEVFSLLKGETVGEPVAGR